MPAGIRLLVLLFMVVFLGASSAQAHFLQTDPVGDRDDLNLYAYVGNDPVNRADPTGKYACGSNLTTAQCTAFLDRQDDTKRIVARGVAQITTLSKDLQAGKLTATDRKVEARIEKYGGKGRGSDQKFLAVLVARAGKMTDQLNGNTPAVNAGFSKDYEATAPRGVLNLFSPYFADKNPQSQSQVIGHEATHHGYFSNDREGYGANSAAANAAFRPNDPDTMNNADGMTYMLGFPPN